MPSIRRMSEKDLGPLTALLADERVMRYLEAPFTPERTQALLAEAVIEAPPATQQAVGSPRSAASS